MRIPAEAIPPVANLSSELLDSDRKTAPVGAAARLADGLSGTPQGRPPPFGENELRPPPAAPATAPPEQENASPGTPTAGERRRAERRSAKQPVLLDTRLKTGRRQGPGEVGINIKV
ncbi:conserved hypothetical protein [Candidatus Accumulibacter aalborgensis]|uniref:Uncharacterized protein n=1 Tax=Candidatus Accumulibacter aalborgensis TaxID=1860102 RepID=A0A1A8XYN3_9PROT|nr:hypothetical protein [Candidatus Accumulibacter aalborgensis]SBT09806.1 conserved hypothetical protein [Candidatus Accumulibacter aalborgensis]